MSRINLRKSHKLGMAAVLGLEGYCRSRLPLRLRELVYLRVSLTNGCTHCIDMHTKALRGDGEREERIAALRGDVPRELFDPRERAALALADAETRIAEGGVPDEVWDAAAAQFTEAELGNLVLAIATINVWNRVVITTQHGA